MPKIKHLSFRNVEREQMLRAESPIVTKQRGETRGISAHESRWIMTRHRLSGFPRPAPTPAGVWLLRRELGPFVGLPVSWGPFVCRRLPDLDCDIRPGPPQHRDAPPGLKRVPPPRPSAWWWPSWASGNRDPLWGHLSSRSRFQRPGTTFPPPLKYVAMDIISTLGRGL